jgi:type I restriction enzyme S subunit
MNRYKSYKLSGIDWIGDIPSSWEVKRVGQLFVQRSETVSDSDFIPLSVSKNGIVPQMDGVAKTDNNDNRKLVKKGDFVINSRSDRKGSSGFSSLDGSVSVINIVLEPKNIYPKFSHYLFRSYLFVEEFFRNGKGIVMDLWSTRYSEMKYMSIPYPSINEQIQIVQYLDYKTELIDKLISTKEHKINLLKEQRTSLINEIVTQGLNPNENLKDSGIDWIGLIPTHFEVKKFKYIFTEKKSTKNPNLNSGSISFGKVVFKDDEKLLESTKDSYQEVLSGEFLINPLNLNFDLKSLRIGRSEIDVVVSQGYIVLKLNEGYFPKYFEYLLRKFDIIKMKSLGNGVRQTISFTHLKDEFLVNPNIETQKEIVEFIDFKTKEIDNLVQLEQKKIELLKEYRQSLISEVVTGKIKVTTDE